MENIRIMENNAMDIIIKIYFEVLNKPIPNPSRQAPIKTINELMYFLGGR